MFWIRKILLKKVDKLGPVPVTIRSSKESRATTTMLNGNILKARATMNEMAKLLPWMPACRCNENINTRQVCTKKIITPSVPSVCVS